MNKGYYSKHIPITSKINCLLGVITLFYGEFDENNRSGRLAGAPHFLLTKWAFNFGDKLTEFQIGSNKLEMSDFQKVCL